MADQTNPSGDVYSISDGFSRWPIAANGAVDECDSGVVRFTVTA